MSLFGLRFVVGIPPAATTIGPADAADPVPGAVVDGPELLFADLGYQIDNMEGLGIHRSPQGETVLTLISDDNFSALQRTILLQFTLIDE